MKTLKTLQHKLNFLSISKERKSKIHAFPRKERSKEYALEFLYYKGINNLPIELKNMEHLFSEYTWIVYTYKEAQECMHLNDPLNIKARNADARTFAPEGKKEILTVYIENKAYPHKDYYTLAHELGHIILGHFFDFYNTGLNRGGLAKKEYKVLEREAEIFAAELIMPAPVLKELKLKNCKNIMCVCKVTKKAAEIRANEILKYRISIRLKDIYITIKNNFYNFIHKKSCSLCGNYIISPDYIYCPICGTSLMWRDGNMVYDDGYELDKGGKALVCPKCENHEINEGNYCKICGAYIINQCSNITGFDGYDGWVDACGKPAKGNARYCVYCGHETTFYQSKFLKNWEEVKEEMEYKKEVEESMEQIAVMENGSILQQAIDFVGEERVEISDEDNLNYNFRREY